VRCRSPAARRGCGSPQKRRDAGCLPTSMPRSAIADAYRTAYLARREAGKPPVPSASEVLAVLRRWSDTAVTQEDVARICREKGLLTI
jgi:hypothetical protein